MGFGCLSPLSEWADCEGKSYPGKVPVNPGFTFLLHLLPLGSFSKVWGY